MRKQWNSKQRFSLRKFSTGLASVLLATMFMSQGTMVQADEVGETITNKEEVVHLKDTNNETTVQPKVTENVVDGKAQASEQPVVAAEQPQPTTPLKKEKEKIEEPKVAFNTTKLESLIKEVEGLNLEKYTEESVKGLNVRLAKAKEVRVNAKSQKEIDSAYNALVGYKNSGLKRVPKLEENNTPKPDTTGGKETVGKKAENTEPNGTNIAGHNHSLNGTTRSEGSGFRTETTNGLSIEVTGDTTFKPGDYLNYNSKYVLMKLKYDKNQYGEKPTFAITGTPNVGIQFESSNPYRDKKKFYNREEGYVSGYLRGTIPKEMIGKYNMLIHMKYNANGVTTTLKFPIEVKPDTPTLKEPIENDGAKYSSLAATTLVGSHSEVKFEVNGQESPWIKASIGEAVYSIEQGFRPGDRVRVKAKAYSDTISVGEHRDKLSPEESESDWSSETILPNFPTPTLNKDSAKNEVNTAFTNKTKQIDQDNSLTNEEKTELKELAKTAKDNAIQNIENAQDETTLNTEKNNGITNIGNVTLPRTAKKAEAKEAIKQAANTRREAIGNQAGLTEEEKATAKQTVTEKETAALSAVDTATTDATVETAKTNGIDEINQVTATGTKKSEAKMLIEQEAMKKKAEISQAELSESEKVLLDARVDQEKAKAFQMIDQATTIEEVDHALMAGIEAIRSIAVASVNGRMTDVTPEESEAAMAQAHRQALPQTGTGNEVAIFGAAASAILAGLGLVVPSKKKED